MGRKTVKVDGIRDAANRMLAVQSHVEGMTPDEAFRYGVFALLESALFDSGNYHGYRYQSSELDEDGSLKSDYDATRRFYL